MLIKQSYTNKNLIFCDEVTYLYVHYVCAWCLWKSEEASITVAIVVLSMCVLENKPGSSTRVASTQSPRHF